MKKILLFIMLSNYLFAGCSQYIDSVNINEVYKPKDGVLGGLMQKPFVEIGSVDGTDLNSSWTIRLSTNAGVYEYSVDTDACNDSDYGGAEVKQDELDLDGMSVSLLDENGDYIDYFVINDDDVEGHRYDCRYSDDIDIDFTNKKDSDRDVYRDPDMSGDWLMKEESGFFSSFNDDDSECDSNDGSSKIFVAIDGDTDGSDDSCDEPKFDTINGALNSIKNGDEGDGPFTLKVCNGDYDEALVLNNEYFNGLVIKAIEDNVNLSNDADILVDINSSDIEKISIYGFKTIEHKANCDNSMGCSTSKYMFNFGENANSSDSKLILGRIGDIKGSCSSFKFGSDFGGEYKFYKLIDMKFECTGFDIDTCNSTQDLFSFKKIGFNLQADKTDQFGFFFGNNVQDECNISMEDIYLNMNQSSGGIRFKELGDFTLNLFDFKNTSSDTTNSAFEAELTGVNYRFDYFDIKNSGKAFNFPTINSDAKFSFGNADYNSSMISRDSDGLIIDSIKNATFHNIIMESKGKGLELDVDGDLNITGVQLNSDACGFEFKNGNPLFDDFHINSGECDYSFKKSSCNKLNTSTAFIKNSSFGLKRSGSSTYPLDWSCDEIELSNSCFCPKSKNDSSAISRNNNFSADGNFWKFLPVGQEYDEDGFQDTTPLDSCPFEEFSDICIRETESVSRFIAYTQKDENNISASHFTTKKVANTFNFTVSAINEEDTSSVLDFNGTVCFQIFNVASDKNYTSWLSLEDFKTEANTTTTQDITLSYVSKMANVKLKWQEDEDKDCTDTDFNENNVSVDYFAIIPTQFILDINTTTMKSAESYTLEINATDNNGNRTQDYNQTFSTGDKNVTLWFISKQSGMEYNKTYNFDITNGSGSTPDFNLSEVGKYVVKVIDTLYSAIDANDTNVSDRSIEGNITIESVPYLFDLNITEHETSIHQEWAYMSQEANESNWTNNMFYRLKATLKAKNKNGDIVKMFDKDEYAWDINTSVNFDLNLSDEDKSRYYKQLSSGFNVSSSEFNTSKETFKDGVSHIELVYRVDKNSSKAISPVRTQLKDFDITNIGDANKNITPVDDNITWYYAKLKTFSIHTSKETETNKFFITLYKEDTKNLKEVSLNWYKNDLDDGVTTSFDFNASKNTNIDNSADQTIDNITFNKGKVSFDITKNSDDKAIIHINTPPYLWYSYGIAIDYNYSSSTFCSQHPCSTYVYRNRDNEDGFKISSGTNNGATINVKSRGEVTRKGIKVFR